MKHEQWAGPCCARCSSLSTSATAQKKTKTEQQTNATSSLASLNAAGTQAFHWHDPWKENLNVYSLIIPFFHPERGGCVCVGMGGV